MNSLGEPPNLLSFDRIESRPRSSVGSERQPSKLDVVGSNPTGVATFPKKTDLLRLGCGHKQVHNTVYLRIDRGIVSYFFHPFDSLAKPSQIHGRYRFLLPEMSECHG
jgi:hypothetical protein